MPSSIFEARCGSRGRVELLERGLVQRELAARMAERRRGLPGAPEQRHVVLAGARLGVRHAVPQLERALEQRLRLAVRVDALGGRRGVHRPLERGGLLAGGGEVVGDGGGEDGAGLLVDALLERARERQVQRGALARQQVVLDHLAQQRVPEAVAAVVVGDEDVAVDRLAQRVAQRALVEAAGLASSGWSVRWPTATSRRISCAGSDSPSTRSISASRSVSGAAPRPSRPAASSSSQYSGLPPERVHSRSSSSASGGAPRMSASWSASSARVSGSSVMRRACGARSSSASSGRSGWRRCSSSGR